MEFRQLKTFKTLATLLNFNRAAQVLNYSQSTVSAQIKCLEEEFGKPLFDRLGKRIALTEAGRILVRYCDKLLSLEEETLAQVTGTEEPRGVLSVRAPQSVSTYYLPQIIESFNRKFPNIGLNINTCAYHVLQQELKSGVTDVAFLITDMVTSRELCSEVLSIERLAIATGPDHPYAGRSHIALEDFKGQTLLIPKHDCAYKMAFEQRLSEANIHVGTIIEYNSVEAIKQCLIRGIGFALLPEMALRQEIQTGLLVTLPLGEETLESALQMIWHKDKWLSPVLTAFMEITRRTISQLNDCHATGSP
jgi:DNA-binding transcriptional LysR family regulator